MSESAGRERALTDDFKKFVAASSPHEDAVYDQVTQLVREAMTKAGEDLSDEVLLALRRWHFTFSLNNRARRDWADKTRK